MKPIFVLVEDNVKTLLEELCRLEGKSQKQILTEGLYLKAKNRK